MPCCRRATPGSPLPPSPRPARPQVDSNFNDVPALHTEKKECYDIIVACRAKIDEIRADFDAKYKEYIKRDRAFRGYVRAQKQQQ